ncbi:MAG: MFS transporter [Chlamydiales bacterium]
MANPIHKKISLSVLFLSAFIDYAGVAIVFTIFAFLLFDPALSFFPPEASEWTRGMWLGVLIALHPLMQFFSSPILGAVSDLRGRKKPLIWSLVISLVGYFFAIVGVHYESLWFLAFYRILAGIGAGNSSILSATVSDLSTSEEKAKNFGFLSMSMGAGFIIAPLLGGFLSKHFGYVIPFFFPFLLVILNLLLVVWRLQETRPVATLKRIGIFQSFTMMQRAFKIKELRFLYLSLLFFSIGWSFFIEFISLFLRKQYGFTAHETGIFYGYGAIFYAVCSGFLIFPVIRRITATRAFLWSMFLAGVSIIALLFIQSRILLWAYVPIAELFLAFVYPAATTVISLTAAESEQGEAIGISHAVNALALGISPFFVGSFVGPYPQAAVWIGGGMMIVASLIFGLYYYTHSRPLSVRDKPLV